MSEEQHALKGAVAQEFLLQYYGDAISIPANHHYLRGHDEIRAWYAKRTGDYQMNIETDVDAVDIVGDVAVVVGTFRVCRAPEEGATGLDHGGRYTESLSLLKESLRIALASLGEDHPTTAPILSNLGQVHVDLEGAGPDRLNHAI